MAAALALALPPLHQFAWLAKSLDRKRERKKRLLFFPPGCPPLLASFQPSAEWMASVSTRKMRKNRRPKRQDGQQQRAFLQTSKGNIPPVKTSRSANRIAGKVENESSNRQNRNDSPLFVSARHQTAFRWRCFSRWKPSPSGFGTQRCRTGPNTQKNQEADGWEKKEPEDNGRERAGVDCTSPRWGLSFEPPLCPRGTRSTSSEKRPKFFLR